MTHIGMVAGELSGDVLGSGLIRALTHDYKTSNQTVGFSGIAGSGMLEAGCQAIYSIDDLSVMGIAEVLRALPRIYFGVYRGIFQHFIEHRPDIFIGIDAPDFNLRLAGKLKNMGVPTVQYVSPTLWAWRESRIKTVKKNIDHVLVILPFEESFYGDHDIASTYVGHPMADKFSLDSEIPERYQIKLELSQDRQYVALLPGSRMSEVKSLLNDFLLTAQHCLKKKPDLVFLIPAANALIAQYIRQHLQNNHSTLPVRIFDGQAHDVIRASQAVLTASGTATLEVMLLKRPMVVAYKLAGLTYMIAKKLVTARYFSLPNLLANEGIIPEFIQDRVEPSAMSSCLLDFLDNGGGANDLMEKFTELHRGLRRNTNAAAAAQVQQLLQKL